MVLFENINKLANTNSIGLGGRRRRLFIPPSTNTPLFQYGDGNDQRSFLSLCSGSVYDRESNDNSDVASVSTSRSLPSTLSSVHTEPDQMTWLLEEQQRRLSSDHLAADNESLKTTDIQSRRDSDLASLDESIEDFENLKTTPKLESKVLLSYSIPLILTFLLEQVFSVVCVLVVGHLGKNELAAVSLATMTSTITLAIFEGISTSLDTLCPQAYGAGNFHGVGVHVQRCCAFSLALFVPFGFAWYYSHYFLSLIIADVEVVRLTNLFLKILITGVPPYIFFENGKRFLQAQGIFEAGTCILFITAPINVILAYVLVWDKRFGLGYIGAPIAASLNFWFMSTLLVCYVLFIDGKKCWGGLTKDLFRSWGELSALAIPGIIMLESEYLAYEILTLFASYFGTAELAAQSAVSTVASLAYMVPFAVGIASSTRIANFVGACNIYSAQVSSRVGLGASLVVAGINCLVLFSSRKRIAHLFSEDPDVVKLIVDLFPLVSVIQLFDGLSAVASGILRAQGNQKIGGIINIVAYYCIAIPISLMLSWHFGLELFGLWIGIGTGMFLIGITETYFVLYADWEQIVEKALLRNELGDEDDEA